MQQKFNVVIERDSEGWLVACVPSLPGCHTQAKSLGELQTRIHEAAALCVEGDTQVGLSRLAKTFSIVLSCMSFLICSSCSSVTYPKPTAKELEIARGFVPPEGKALIVAYRKSSAAPFAKTVPTGLWIDGKPYGANKAGTFVVAPASKGSHNIDLFSDSGGEGQSFNVIVSPGDVLFFRQHVDNEVTGTMLIPAGGILTPAPIGGMRIYATRVTEDVGRKEVSQCVQHGNGGKISVSTWP